MRMSRRAGLIKSVKLPSLYEFWDDAVVVQCLGANSSTAAYYSGLLVGDTSTTLWVFVSKGDASSFNKIKDNVRDPIAYYYADDTLQIEPAMIYIDTGTTSATKVKINPSESAFSEIYGYVLAAFRFPSFSDNIVETMIRKMHISFDAYQYGSSAASFYIPDSSLSSDPNDVYLQVGSTASAGYISATRGGTPGTAIMTSGSRAFWRHNNSRYYWSTNGTNNSTSRVGNLCRITL